ncbi:MAG: TolC family protein [Bacteroidia bacterium]|nr:TolC family protein [Bacteroidia bacterium]
MKSKVSHIAAFILLSAGIAKSQELLTIDNAIKLGLEKNYSVLIVKNEQEIAKAQNNFGAAGMSPTVTLNGNIGSSNLNSHQEFNTGAVQDRPGAVSNNLGASVNASWIIFDGLRMFAVKKRLELNEGLSAFELKQQMENTVYEIISAYYNISRIEGLIKAAKQNLAIYEERKKIANLKLQVGSDSKVDLLLSQTDENRAKSTIIDLEIQLLTAKVNLNNLLSRPVDTDFKTSDSIQVNYNPALEELKKSALASNSSLLINKQNELIFSQSVKEARSANLPFVTLNGAYQFTRNTSQAGIVFLNRQNGLVGGISVSWLIFNGNRNNRLVKERSLQYLNQRYLTEQDQLKVDGDVFVSYKTFLMNKQIVELESQNMSDSKTLQEISLERYKIGKSNLLETIETQKNLEDAQTRYFNALYNIKLAEAELLRTNGTLVK